MIAAARDAAPSDLAELIDRQLGAFHLEMMLAHVPRVSAELLDFQRLAVLKNELSTTKQVDLALTQCAFPHETRHFHDSFGTRAGITLFLSRLALLRRFAELSLELGAGGYVWPVPVTAAKDTSLPDSGGRFLLFAWRTLAAGSRFRGDLPALTVEPNQIVDTIAGAHYGDKVTMAKAFAALLNEESHEPHPVPYVSWLKEDRCDTKFTAFPARAFVLRDERQMPCVQMAPLAFDTLLEGNAQVLQRNLIETIWGDEVALKTFMLLGISSYEPGSPRAVGYNVSDLMVTRFLENHGQRKKTFPRKSVLTLADRALTAGCFAVLDAPGPGGQTISLMMSCPGIAFAEDLEEVGPDAIRSGTVPPAALDRYAELRDFFATVPVPQDHATGLAPALAEIELLYRWIVHEIIVPLLEARLTTSGRLLADYDCYLERFLSLPPVPFTVGVDGVVRTTAPPRIQTAWLRVAMMDRLMTQPVQGEPVLRCPRAHAQLPGLRKLNLAYEGDCQDYIEADLCGRFSAAVGITGLPRCGFTDALRQLQFTGTFGAASAGRRRPPE